MFTEKQVRQFYVTNSNAVGPAGDNPTNASNAGAMKFVASGDVAYFLYKGPSDDGLQRSDLLKKCNIMSVNLTDAWDMVHVMKKVEVTLDSNVSATPVVGQDYILNIEVKNYIATGDDSTFRKFGAAHAFNTTASDLYRDLALSLAKNFGNLGTPLIKVSLKTASDPVVVTNKTTKASLNGTYTGIYIEEVEQPWRRGAAKQEFVNFEVMPSTIYTGGADQIWGKAEDKTPALYDDGSPNAAVVVGTNALANSKKVADMEYFFHKERGDVYGYQGWPNNIDTIYQVDPANANGYSFVDIHFYFEGNSHNVGKSEKTLTIVGPKTNINTLLGVATSGSETGLYAFLKDTGVTVVKSKGW